MKDGTEVALGVGAGCFVVILSWLLRLAVLATFVWVVVWVLQQMNVI